MDSKLKQVQKAKTAYTRGIEDPHDNNKTDLNATRKTDAGIKKIINKLAWLLIPGLLLVGAAYFGLFGGGELRMLAVVYVYPVWVAAWMIHTIVETVSVHKNKEPKSRNINICLLLAVLFIAVLCNKYIRFI